MDIEPLNVRETYLQALGEGEEYDELEVALLGLAQAQANDIAALEVLLAEQGMTVEGSKGQLRLNPIVSELRQARRSLSLILGGIRLPSEAPVKNPVKQRAAERSWANRRRSA